ncbi:17117_t:CDS:2 [Entrophospora sp. SA101]|nr:17117_t:CDS:2 [Entrophospora sp. SA101]
MKQVFSVEVGPEVEGETRIRRSYLSPDELLSTPKKGIKTLYDIVQHGVKKYGSNKNAIGYRKVVKIVEEEKEITKIVGDVETKEKKTWKYFQLSGYNWLTYSDFDRDIGMIGSGLLQLGFGKYSKITVYAATSVNWMLMAHGCFTQGMTIVTAYDTLGEEGLVHSMNEAEIHGMFTNADLLPMIKKIAKKCPLLECVIYDGEPKEGIIEELAHIYLNIRFLSIDELKNLSRNSPIKYNPPGPQDLCCIMYTSGSTGNPKGVLLTHANIVSAVSGAGKLIGPLIREDDALLAYLPLAHVLEFVVEHLCLWWGVPMGYGSILTLTDSSVRNCQGDLRELRPTIMTGVPAVWESIRKGVITKVQEGGPTIQKMFKAAFKAKGWLKSKYLPTKLVDLLIFNKIKLVTGGRLRFALSGGAPISKETQVFLCTTLCPILQGYGMTETCGMCTILTLDQFSYGSVGAPVPCTEIKLVDVPAAGYKATNLQGEIWIRGPVVTSGYYKNDKATKETFTDDGWLRTGDIGEWRSDGTLNIIDRVKNLVKLSHGEYIALEKLESVYKSAIYVSNICVYADSFQARPVALIIPVEAQIKKLAIEKNIHGSSFEELCKNKEITNVVLQACTAEAKKADFKPAEFLSAITLMSDEWTAQNGLVTAALKIKRKDIQQKYQHDIDVMYGKK